MRDGGTEQGVRRFHPHCVRDILDELRELAKDGDKVAIGDVVAAIRGRSYGPFLLIPALLELTPLGAIPGMPTFLALLVALVAVQLLIGRRHLWLPAFISCRARPSAEIRKAADKLEKIAGWLDRWFHGRMLSFVHPPVPRMAAAIVLLLCFTVPPLEFLPFASSAPMAAIAAFGIALLVHDGLLMLAAVAASVGALWLGAGMLGSTGILAGVG